MSSLAAAAGRKRAVVAALLASVALVATTGCGNDDGGGADSGAKSDVGTSSDAGAGGDVSADGESADSATTGQECSSKADCKGGYCVPSAEGPLTCRACVLDSHCADGRCIAGACVADATCKSDKDCLAHNAVCDLDGGVCVECSKDDDCTTGGCAANRCKGSYVPCTSSKACADVVGVCDTKAGQCVDCVADADCDPTQHCAAGACRADVCTQGKSVCSDDGKSVVTCSASGDEATTTDCAAGQVCKAGACEKPAAPVCTPGAKTCSGQTVLECDKDGAAYVKAGTCSKDELCDEGACKTLICTPGKAKCKGKEVWTCGAKGLAESKTTTCPGACEAGACQGLACTPGSKSCKGDEVWVCQGDGSGTVKLAACPSGTSCDKGECKTGTQVCTPGEKSCKANEVWLCKADGSGTSKLADCPSGTTCAKGECVGPTKCKQGDAKCDGDKQLICDAAGKWVAAVCDDQNACTKDTCNATSGACKHTPMPDGSACGGGSCKAGKCQGSCKPGTLVGNAVTILQGSNLNTQVSKSHVMLAFKNPNNAKFKKLVSKSWDGKTLWEAVPSPTATEVLRASAWPMPDMGALALIHELDNPKAKNPQVRVLRYDSKGKITQNYLFPTIGQDLVAQHSGYLDPWSNGQFISAGDIGKPNGQKSYLGRGRYVAVFDAAGKLAKFAHHASKTEERIMLPTLLAPDQLWALEMTHKNGGNTGPWVYEARKLDTQAAWNSILNPFGGKVESPKPILFGSGGVGRSVAYVRASNSSVTKQYLAFASGSGSWVKGDDVQASIHGNIYATRDAVATKSGVIFVGKRSSAGATQTVLVRATSKGKLIGITALPAAKWIPMNALGLETGNIRLLTAESLGGGVSQVAVREVCAP